MTGRPESRPSIPYAKLTQLPQTAMLIAVLAVLAASVGYGVATLRDVGHRLDDLEGTVGRLGTGVSPQTDTPGSGGAPAASGTGEPTVQVQPMIHIEVTDCGRATRANVRRFTASGIVVNEVEAGGRVEVSIAVEWQHADGSILEDTFVLVEDLRPGVRRRWIAEGQEYAPIGGEEGSYVFPEAATATPSSCHAFVETTAT